MKESHMVEHATYEKQSLLARLRSSEERLLKVLQGVSESQAAFRPAADCWSIRETVEHVALAEEQMMQAIRDGVANSDPPDLEMDARILALGADRSTKRNAPESTRPTGKIVSLGQSVAAFKHARRRTLDAVSDTAEDFRRKKVTFAVGSFDGYQVLLMIALHAERHALQIAEIKDHHGFRTVHSYVHG